MSASRPLAQPPPAPVRDAGLRRDPYTWLAYGLLACFAHVQAGLGPLIAFLRAELGLSYTVGGLHVSAFALGMVGGGLSGDRLAARWGRRRLLWRGTAGMAAGTLFLGLAHHVALTVAAALLIGFLGILVVIMVQATLSDHHGPRRAAALTEANLGAILAAGLAPLCLGLAHGTRLGWRAALGGAVLALALVALAGRRLAVPSAVPPVAAMAPRRRLPAVFWALWTVLLLTVAMEWSVVGWGTELLANLGGLSLDRAAPLFSLYFAGGAVGRFANSRWAVRVPARHLLLYMLAVVAVGLPLFWLVNQAGLRLAGLALLGFGISSLFPLGLGAALEVAQDHSDAASSRVTLAAGTAMLLAPFTLGWLADHVGLQRAFGVVALFLVAAVAVTLATHRALTRRDGAVLASGHEAGR